MRIYMSAAAKQAAAGGRLKATAGAACQLLSLLLLTPRSEAVQVEVRVMPAYFGSNC